MYVKVKAKEVHAVILAGGGSLTLVLSSLYNIGAVYKEALSFAQLIISLTVLFSQRNIRITVLISAYLKHLTENFSIAQRLKMRMLKLAHILTKLL